MIFLSYCQKNKKEKKLISNVHENLLKINKNVFLDTETIYLGDRYWEKINKAIDKTKIFIFFNSKNYSNSATCWKEFHIAYEKYKKNENNFTFIEIKMNKNSLTPSCLPKDNLYFCYNGKNENEMIMKIKNIVLNPKNIFINKTKNNLELLSHKKDILETINSIMEGNINDDNDVIINFLIEEKIIILKNKSKIEYLSTNKSVRDEFQINNEIYILDEFNEYLEWLQQEEDNNGKK
ncbi:MAG: toll/interleukin-1 receptor domain-containing protein [Metamycoplasmataceae bacterium]